MMLKNNLKKKIIKKLKISQESILSVRHKKVYKLIHLLPLLTLKVI